MPRQSLEERVLQLERTLGSIQHEIIGARQPLPKFDNRPQVRVARVANNPTSGDNTFQIVFLDGSYPKASGNQTPTYLDRQLTAKEVAFNLAGTELNQGDKVPVYFSNGHWWLYAPEGSTPPPPGDGNLSNVFTDGRYFFWDTPSMMYPLTTDHAAFMPSGPDSRRKYLAFITKRGPDLGINHDYTHATTPHHFTFTQAGTYVIHFRCNVVPVRIDTVRPTPAQPFGFYAEFVGTSGGLGIGDTTGINKVLMDSIHWFDTDFGDIGTYSTLSYGLLKKGAGDYQSPMTVRVFQSSVPYSVTIPIQLIPATSTDFGIVIDNVAMVITKLFE